MPPILAHGRDHRLALLGASAPAPVYSWPQTCEDGREPLRLLRISAQAYNSIADFERLAAVLRELRTISAWARMLAREVTRMDERPTDELLDENRPAELDDEEAPAPPAETVGPDGQPIGEDNIRDGTVGGSMYRHSSQGQGQG